MFCPAEVGETVGAVKVFERIVGGAEVSERTVGGVERAVVMGWDVVEVVPAGADEPGCE